MNELLTQRLAKRNIKVAIRDIITKAQTQAANRIHISRSIPPRPDDSDETAPIVLIYSVSEQGEVFDRAPKRYRRILNINIELIDIGSSDDEVDGRLEFLGEEIETALELNDTLNGTCSRFEFAGSQYQFEPDGQSPAGALVLQYQVEFFTQAHRSGSMCYDDLKIIDIDWKVGHDGTEAPGRQVDAEDTIQGLESL